MYKSTTSDSNKMKAKKSFLSKVMKAAWTKFRKGGISWAKAMKSAWAWAKKNLVKNELPTKFAYSGEVIEQRDAAILVQIEGFTNSFFSGLPKYYNFWLPKVAFIEQKESKVVLNYFGSKLLNEKMQAVNFHTIIFQS